MRTLDSRALSAKIRTVRTGASPRLSALRCSSELHREVPAGVQMGAGPRAGSLQATCPLEYLSVAGGTQAMVAYRQPRRLVGAWSLLPPAQAL